MFIHAELAKERKMIFLSSKDSIHLDPETES